MGEDRHLAALSINGVNHVVPVQMQYAIRYPEFLIDALAGTQPNTKFIQQPPQSGGFVTRPQLASVPLVATPGANPFAMMWVMPMHPVPEINVENRFHRRPPKFTYPHHGHPPSKISVQVPHFFYYNDPNMFMTNKQEDLTLYY